MMVAADARQVARAGRAPWLHYGSAALLLAVGVVALVAVDGVLVPRYLAKAGAPPPPIREGVVVPTWPAPVTAVRALPVTVPEPPVPVDRAGESPPSFVPLLFARSSAWLTPASRAALAQVAAAMAKQPTRRLVLSGHTDASGPEYLNHALSLARAQRCQAWLVAHGISPERLEVQGLGSSRPLGPEDSLRARARNRRVEFELR